MAMLGKEALKHSTLKREVVHIPEWGGDAIVRELSAREQAELTAARKQVIGGDVDAGMRVMAQVVACAWVDENGDRILTTQEEIDALLDQSVGVLSAISDVAMRLSGDSKGAAEEAKKNLKTTPNEDSGSASQPSSEAAQ